MPEKARIRIVKKFKSNFLKKITPTNHWLFSMSVGLVCAGILCSGVYVFADMGGGGVARYFLPGEQVSAPNCTPGSQYCDVQAPVVSSGTQDITTTGNGTFSGFTMPTGAQNNYVLTSDASGNASWQSLGTVENPFDQNLNTTNSPAFGTLFVGTAEGDELSQTDNPDASNFTTSHTPIAESISGVDNNPSYQEYEDDPGSVSFTLDHSVDPGTFYCYYDDGGCYSSDNGNGTGNLISSDDGETVIGTINYSTGAVDTTGYSSDKIYSVYYSYQFGDYDEYPESGAGETGYLNYQTEHGNISLGNFTCWYDDDENYCYGDSNGNIIDGNSQEIIGTINYSTGEFSVVDSDVISEISYNTGNQYSEYEGQTNFLTSNAPIHPGNVSCNYVVPGDHSNDDSQNCHDDGENKLISSDGNSQIGTIDYSTGAVDTTQNGNAIITEIDYYTQQQATGTFSDDGNGNLVDYGYYNVPQENNVIATVNYSTGQVVDQTGGAIKTESISYHYYGAGTAPELANGDAQFMGNGAFGGGIITMGLSQFDVSNLSGYGQGFVGSYKDTNNTWNGNGFAFTNSSIGSGDVYGLVVNSDIMYFGDAATDTAFFTANSEGINSDGTISGGTLTDGVCTISDGILSSGCDISRATGGSGGGSYADITDTEGNVGIGTTNPGALLDLNSAVGDDTTTDILRLTNTADSDSGREAIGFYQAFSLAFGRYGSMESAQISSSPGYAFGGSKLFFSTADSGINGASVLHDRMVIDSAGNVGIGTTTPTHTLDVAGDINFTGTLYQGGVAFSGGGGSSYGLVGEWPGDGDTNDYSGYGNNGTWAGDSTYDSNGKFGQAFNFQGSYSSVSVPDSPKLDFGANQDFTLSAWVKKDSTASFQIMSKTDGTNGYYFAFGYDLFMRLYSGGSNENIDAGYPSNNVWHHVVAMRQGNKMEIYVDGAIAASQTTTITGSTVNNEPLTIGGYSGGSISIEQVQIFNRALSSAEVENLYNSGSGSDSGGSSYADITDTGENVGIGTITPSSKLEVALTGDIDSTDNIATFNNDSYWDGTSDSGQTTLLDFQARRWSGSAWVSNENAAAIGFQKETSWNGISSTENAALVFDTTGAGSLSEKMRITSDGKMGIGTTAPGALLDITGSVGNDTTTDVLRLSNTAYSASGREAIGFYQSSGTPMESAQISSSPGGVFGASKLFFSVADSGINGAAVLHDRMVIDSAGDVGIGNMNPATALDVNGTGTFGNIIDSSLVAGGACATLGTNANGQVWCASSSSERFKQNINDLSFDEGTFLSLTPRTFEYTSNFDVPGTQVGFIAEEVLPIFPDLVTYDNNNQPNGIKYDKLPVYLYAIVQKQQDEISKINLALGLSADGSVGDGSVQGIDFTNPFVAGIKNILAALGIKTDNNGSVQKIQMVTPDGTTYCTWIDDNGDWQKVKGNCDEVDTNADMAAPTVPTSPSTPDSQVSPPADNTPVPTDTSSITSDTTSTTDSPVIPPVDPATDQDQSQ